MAFDPIISAAYKGRFIDDHSLSPNAQEMLQGVAAVLEDETDNWRPTLTELLKVIPHNDFGERLIKAGYAYGIGKQLRGHFAAPSILMFCSALNRIGEAPNVKLKDQLSAAQKKIDNAGLSNDEEIQSIIQAAKERASFDKVSEMLRNEFRKGLIRKGGYSGEELEQIVHKIVNIGHHARHDALIDVIEWSTVPVSDFMFMSVPNIPQNQKFWNALLQKAPDGHTFYGTGRLGSLAYQAQTGCAQAILLRLEQLRDHKDK
jgi:hypothetical protein